ncbi:MAG: hypothetical protein ABIE70_05110 [bacterium]
MTRCFLILLLCVFLTAFVTTVPAVPDSTEFEGYLKDYDATSQGTMQRPPEIDFRVHRNGRLWNTVNNNGIMGNVYGFPLSDMYKAAPSFRFPGYSQTTYGQQIGLWVGGVVNGDTLVSTTIDELGQQEFWPDYYPFGQFEAKSTNPTSPDYSIRARAEQEFRCVYTDTFQYEDFVPSNNYDRRKHQPLNIAVMQTSFSWSNSYAADFMIVDYGVQNLGDDTIKSAYIGLYYTGFIWHRGEQPYPIADEVEGYIDSIPYEYEGLGYEPLHLAWVTDKDGRCMTYGWDFINTPNAIGIAPLHLPHGTRTCNFNWWIHQPGSYYNWGPRMQDSDDYPLRLFFGGLGRPLSDLNRYYLMAKPEVDYSGFEAAVNFMGRGWLPPHRQKQRIALGHVVNMVTSFGPFTLPPRTADTLTVVVSAGENVHTNPDAYTELYDFRNPWPFMNYLDFDDLINNVRWAKMIYDNPGVDTDGDGDSGMAFWYVDEELNDSSWVYYRGDGAADFRGATPPPSPLLRISAEDHRLTVRWNGYTTENYVDPMTHVKDFEGYRVYLSRSERTEEAMLLASYDQENYNRYRYNKLRQKWEVKELPFSLDSLRALYGEDFDPLDHPQGDPLTFGTVTYYFTKVDYNLSDDRSLQGIHRRYPDAARDPHDVDEAGRPRYWEWEYIIDDLLSTVPFYVSVTAFDFGHMPRDLPAMESTVSENQIRAMAAEPFGVGRNDNKLDVYCYPNPYRIDAGYYAAGFENREDETSAERARTIWFANLPEECTVSIYSLDGDLIRKLDHDGTKEPGMASHLRWDLINRNREPVVTGLYYWVVESGLGSQIGKLVILK